MDAAKLNIFGTILGLVDTKKYCVLVPSTTGNTVRLLADSFDELICLKENTAKMMMPNPANEASKFVASFAVFDGQKLHRKNYKTYIKQLYREFNHPFCSVIQCRLA